LNPDPQHCLQEVLSPLASTEERCWCWQEPDEPEEEEENAEEDENSRLSAASSAAAATSAKKKKKEEKTSRSAVFSLARLSLKRHDDKMKRFQNVML